MERFLFFVSTSCPEHSFLKIYLFFMITGQSAQLVCPGKKNSTRYNYILTNVVLIVCKV